MFNPEWVGGVFVAEAAMKETCPLKAWPTTRSMSIVCAEDRTISPPWSRRIARERLGVEPVELAGGHCPHVSRPGTLAEVLDRGARGHL
jgi:pimeloyl-ACP methyl ester carboxylesterase